MSALTHFEVRIASAMADLRDRNEMRSPFAREVFLRSALENMSEALKLANRMRDAARKALCLRVLNWLRADLRRTA